MNTKPGIKFHTLMILACCCIMALCFSSCISKKEPEAPDQRQPRLPRAPTEIEAKLNRYFPGAMPGPALADSLLHYLGAKYGIRPEDILLGTSTCVDDVISTKNFHVHSEIKGPFHLGGLAGIPFTGISGLEAFAHHIPEGGTMVLLVEPHIGYSAGKGWGYILRDGQAEGSSCCGALMGTLGKLQKGLITPVITEDDYQGDKIGEFTLAHKDEILNAEEPIVELTKITANEAERQILAHVEDIDVHNVKYIIMITGVLIDTDYNYTDYWYADHIRVYDPVKKEFVEELRNPLVGK